MPSPVEIHQRLAGSGGGGGKGEGSPMKRPKLAHANTFVCSPTSGGPFILIKLG